jgi:hypothetical protein
MENIRGKSVHVSFSSDGKYKLPGLFMVGPGSFHFFFFIFFLKNHGCSYVFFVLGSRRAVVRVWNICAILRSLVKPYDTYIICDLDET